MFNFCLKPRISILSYRKISFLPYSDEYLNEMAFRTRKNKKNDGWDLILSIEKLTFAIAV